MFSIVSLIKNPITYKILTDIFLLVLLVTGGFIISETILPGILSAYISPFTLFVIVFFIMNIISFIAHKQGAYAPITKSKNILLNLSLPLFIILISITSIGYGYFFGSIIIFFSIMTFFLLNTLLHDILHTNNIERS